jgi:hypothetical protein
MNAPPPPSPDLTAAGPAVSVPELIFIAILMLFFAVWGWRHGLDAVLIAGIFVLFGRFSADILAKPVASAVNIFTGVFKVLTGGQFSREALMAAIFGGDKAPPLLIDMTKPDDLILKWIGTILFAMIVYIGFKFAFKKAGGRDPLIERLFGFFGGGIVGYMCVTYVLDRHVTFPAAVLIQPSDVPQIAVDAPLFVVIVLVLVVFGVGRAKPAKKK